MNPNKRAKLSQQVTWIGALVDLLLAVFKIIIGLIGNSGALLADGIHSLSDLLSDGIVLYATRQASDAPDAQHPYGHGRFETVATLALSIILAMVGTGIMFDAVNRLSHPTALSHSTLLLGIAALSIVSKEILYWYTLRVAKVCQSRLLEANAWHHRSDAFSSVVVLIGIIGALNGYPYLDSVAAMIVGLMILLIAWKLGLGAIQELVDTSIDEGQIGQLTQAIQNIAAVNSVHSLRTRKIGPMICCDVHVQVDPFLSVSEGHIVSVSVERVARTCLPNLDDVTVHIDPEDDEINTPHQPLPERERALKILQSALNHSYDGNITRIQLHYLDGTIHVDFYLPLSATKSNRHRQKIQRALNEMVQGLADFGNVRLYFGDD